MNPDSEKGFFRESGWIRTPDLGFVTKKFEESQYIHSSLDSVKYDTSKLHDPDPLTQLNRIHIFQYVVTGNWSSITGIRFPTGIEQVRSTYCAVRKCNEDLLPGFRIRIRIRIRIRMDPH